MYTQVQERLNAMTKHDIVNVSTFLRTNNMHIFYKCGIYKYAAFEVLKGYAIFEVYILLRNMPR